MLPLLLALMQPVHAQEVGARGPRFVLVVRDEAGLLFGKSVSARVGAAELSLRDDGSSPDLAAGDGIYSVDVEGQLGEQVPITLLADGEELVSSEQTIALDMSLPSIRVVLEGPGEAQWRVQSDQPVSTGERFELSESGAGRSGLQLSAFARPMSLGFAVGLVVGAGGLVLWRRRRRAEPFSRPGGAALPLLPEGPLLLSTPDAAGSLLVLEALAFALQGHCAPLLLASPGLRGELARALAGLTGGHQLDLDRPTVPRLLAGAALLADQGPVLLLVEGSAALEAPEAKEEPHVVVSELLDLAGGPVVVVGDASQALPREAVAVVEQAGDLVGAGLRFWRDAEGRARVERVGVEPGPGTP